MSLNGNFGRCGGPPPKGTSANPHAGQAGPFQLEGKRSGKGEGTHPLHPKFCSEVWLEMAQRRRFRQEQRGDTSLLHTSVEHFWNTICIWLTGYGMVARKLMWVQPPLGAPVRPLLIHFPVRVCVPLFHSPLPLGLT
jgi:hypothetical protein